MKYDYAIVIGRFQPIHLGHVRLIKNALEMADEVIVCIGSANAPRTPRNPFSYEERQKLIRAEFPVGTKLEFIALDDMLYNDGAWVKQVHYKVNTVILRQSRDPDTVSIALSGYEKDATSYYLKYFPEWKSEFHTLEGDYNSTEIREFFYTAAMSRGVEPDRWLVPDNLWGIDIGIPPNSLILSEPETYQARFHSLAFEWDFNKKYDPSKFPIFVATVDAVVTANLHVLLITRKSAPGKGLLALPGGHVNPDEKLEQAMLRELREETSIDRSDRVLKSNIRCKEIFDHPQRSERGRVITTAFHIQLPDEDKLPKIKAGDDAAKARWVPLSEIRKSDMFEDHFDIITNLTRSM